MITPAQVKVAEYILDSSGIVEILQTELTTDLRGRKPNVDSIRLYSSNSMLNCCVGNIQDRCRNLLNSFGSPKNLDTK